MSLAEEMEVMEERARLSLSMSERSDSGMDIVSVVGC